MEEEAKWLDFKMSLANEIHISGLRKYRIRFLSFELEMKEKENLRVSSINRENVFYTVVIIIEMIHT